MCTTVMNWLEMLVCIRQEIEGIVWNYVIPPALWRPLDFCMKAGDLSFFFLSLNHVVIACYLHLTLQTIEEMLQDWWSWPVLTPKRKRSRSNLISLELLLTNSRNLKVYLDVLNLIFSFNLYLHRGKNKSPAPIKAIPTQRSYNQKLLQPGQWGGSKERRVGG